LLSKQIFSKHFFLLSGSIGTLILQIPVEGGHEGGRFNVYAINDSHHSMVPITEAKVNLIYNLVWENAENIIPQDFPVFLTAVKEIQKSLSSWISADQSIPTTKSKLLQITRLSDRLSSIRRRIPR
jgi:hypothetical protein